jgi:ribA/ribD-fused uncharacterized protein
MSKVIDSFRGEYEFLSNFYVHPVTYENMVYPTTEHAFQAAKSLDINKRKEIKKAKTARAAKKLGRKVDLRKDWEFIKVDVMRTVLKDKFKDPVLRQLLLDTGDARLVEGNTWGDTFWGVCKGQGKNWLGKLLMEIRQDVLDVKDGKAIELTFQLDKATVPDIDNEEEWDDFVNNIKHLKTPEEKLKAIREAIWPIAQKFYNGGPAEFKIPKRMMCTLHVLVVNNANWE